ncbi:MAG: Potassium-transporting ATPase chain, partial [Firmicutes bacterium]|nr:Potassium-transporting ATPase chain [Bacillota bacterium]
MSTHSNSFNKKILMQACREALYKLNPKVQVRNPVMFIVLIGSLLTTGFVLRDLFQGSAGNTSFALQITVWLWFTVLFANFAEAIAEGRGKAQAQALRQTRTQTQAKKIIHDKPQVVEAASLRKGDIVLVEPGDLIP